MPTSTSSPARRPTSSSTSTPASRWSERGNSGQFNLKPVISAVPLASEVGLRVTGYVAPALANPSTRVSVQVNGVPVRSTAPESTGRFVLYPVPSGAYDLVVSSGGRVTAVITGVPVTQRRPQR